MDLTTTSCINCGSAVSTAYCANCGQSNPPKKLNLLTLYSDFQSRIYGFDGMFPRTLRDLTLRPGEVALSYIRGNRVKYVAPVGYFFLALTMYLLFLELLDIDMFELSKTNNPLDTATSKNQEAFQRAFTDLISRYMRIFSFMLIPITALFAWMLFKKQKFNVLEHSILIFYVWGHLLWLSIINLFLFKISGWNLNIFQILLQAVFYAFGCLSLYKYQSKVKVFIKGLTVCFLAFTIYTILISILGFAYLMTNPEMMELLKNK